jgi:hypothetical protein
MTAGPVLVTGAARSGTTWMARMLALSPGSTMPGREPFNPHGRQYGLGGAARWSYSYGSDLDQARADAVYRRILAGRSLRAVGRYGERQWRYLLRPRATRLIIKDPHATLAAAWLEERFALTPVVMVRHPCAHAASLKRMGWVPDPTQFLGQPRLMADHLEPLRTELEDPPTDPVGRAALLWKALYHVVARQHRNTRMEVVCHETVSLDPVPELERLYRRLGLGWSPELAAAITATTATSNPTSAAPGELHRFRRNSAANVDVWRRVLTDEEISTVLTITEPVRDCFYPE